MRVGRDHIASVVNTLFLAYAGDYVLAVVLLVGALKGDQPAWFSNYGPGVDVWAPGQEVWSSGGYRCPDPIPLNLLEDANFTLKTCADFSRVLAGTSMAAHHVTGVAALVLEANPDLTPAEVKECIVSSATTVGDRRHLNAYEAVRCAQDGEEDFDGFPGITFDLPDVGTWTAGLPDGDPWEYDLRFTLDDVEVPTEGPIGDPTVTTVFVQLQQGASSVDEAVQQFDGFAMAFEDVAVPGADTARRYSWQDSHGWFEGVFVEFDGIVVAVDIVQDVGPLQHHDLVAFLDTVRVDRDEFCAVTDQC
jgi:hypothetical protein